MAPFPWSIRMSHKKGLEYTCINSVDRGQPPIDIETMEPVIPAAHYAVGSGIFKYRNYLTLTRLPDYPTSSKKGSTFRSAVGY